MIQLWMGENQTVGSPAPGQDVVNILGTASAISGIDSMSYRLNGGPRMPLPLGPTAFRLHRQGDFNIELPVSELQRGNNTIELYAVTRFGREETVAATLRYPGETRFPLPYEHSLRDLGTPATVAEIVHVVDGPWIPERGGIRPKYAAYDRVFLVGDPTWKDYEIRVDLRLLGYSHRRRSYRYPSAGCGVGIGAGWRGHTDWFDIHPRRGYLPSGTLLWLSADGGVGLNARPPRRTNTRTERFYLQSCSPQTPLQVTAETRRTIENKRRYTVRLRYTPDQPTAYAAKLWPTGENEPSEWALTAPRLEGETTSGSVAFVAHNTIVEFSDLVATPV